MVLCYENCQICLILSLETLLNFVPGRVSTCRLIQIPKLTSRARAIPSRRQEFPTCLARLPTVCQSGGISKTCQVIHWLSIGSQKTAYIRFLSHWLRSQTNGLKVIYINVLQWQKHISVFYAFIKRSLDVETTSFVFGFRKDQLLNLNSYGVKHRSSILTDPIYLQTTPSRNWNRGYKGSRINNEDPSLYVELIIRTSHWEGWATELNYSELWRPSPIYRRVILVVKVR